MASDGMSAKIRTSAVCFAVRRKSVDFIRIPFVCEASRMFFQRFGGRLEGRGCVDSFAYAKIVSSWAQQCCVPTNEAELSTRPVREGITFCSLRGGHSFDR